MKNESLQDFLKNSKKELSHVVRHRRGIILGYQKVNLDSMMREGLICESERCLAHFELDKYYERLR